MSLKGVIYKPYSRILILTICSLNKKRGGVTVYDEASALAYRLKETRDYLFKARREAFDLLFSGEIKWRGVSSGNLVYNKELNLGKDFGGNVIDAKYLPAVYRYDGRFFKALDREGKDKLLRSRHHVLFQSGLYGLVMPEEPIQLYSLPIESGSKVQGIWKENNTITRILVEYTKVHGIERIFDLTSRKDYRELVNWNLVAKTTGARVLYCFWTMGAGADALISFGDLMKNYILDASEEELLAIKPETTVNEVIFRDVPYTLEDLPSEDLKRIQLAEREIPQSLAYPIEEIPSKLSLGKSSEIQRGNDWLISITSQFYKSLPHISDKTMEGRILEAIVSISQNPAEPRGDTIKPLQGPFKGMWRYRIGDHRLIYRPNIEKHIVYLLWVAPRGNVYN